jgi:hypothetical protein
MAFLMVGFENVIPGYLVFFPAGTDFSKGLGPVPMIMKIFREESEIRAKLPPDVSCSIVNDTVCVGPYSTKQRCATRFAKRI